MSLLETGREIASTLGSLASMLNVYFAYRSTRTGIGKEEVASVEEAGFTSNQYSLSEASVNALTQVISERLLDSYRQNIKKAEDRFVRSIADVRNTPAQKDQEADIARAEVCAIFQMILDHNEQTFPDQGFEKMWKQFRCLKQLP